MTVAVAGSTVTIVPVLNRSNAVVSPMTAGMSSSRAITAAWETSPPLVVTSAPRKREDRVPRWTGGSGDDDVADLDDVHGGARVINDDGTSGVSPCADSDPFSAAEHVIRRCELGSTDEGESSRECPKWRNRELRSERRRRVQG